MRNSSDDRPLQTGCQICLLIFGSENLQVTAERSQLIPYEAYQEASKDSTKFSLFFPQFDSITPT